MKIGIGFVTGRKGFKHLFRTYVNSWSEHGFVEDKETTIKLLVAYDLSYFKTRATDYTRVDPELAKKLDGISYFGTTRIADERQMLVKEGVIDSSESMLLFGEGYGKKRNAVVWFAVRAGLDRLLFIDDDEYPLAVQRGDPVHWRGQSVLGAHLFASSDADITHGRHCGYISPIPKIKFDSSLPEDTFAELIGALSNDIVSWETIRKVVIGDGGVTYADPRIVDGIPPEEVHSVKGMKFISGANLCLNLRKGGADSPFFNPPGARGEDTFLSTCLEDKRVLRVPAYTFHDAFLTYKALLHGVLPRRLDPVDALDPNVVKRFAKASIGWVRYKPLLTYVTDRSAYESTVESMKDTFERLGPGLRTYFKADEFTRLLPELKKYSDKVPEHHELFERTKEAWRKALPWARQNPTGNGF
ncbi:MAG: hypothetical protein CVV47_02080 [Spirochaetae bacterium HGW-Spirochaetae-3]|jgi:hypothetical protein|nr:MAG: hypothetical protein CVV47_02080 [Spirochaetae bacterium HGW-Spirochaetae-3]